MTDSISYRLNQQSKIQKPIYKPSPPDVRPIPNASTIPTLPLFCPYIPLIPLMQYNILSLSTSIHMPKSSSHNWSTEQDSLLHSLVTSSPTSSRIPWSTLAEQLSHLSTKPRTGKQCRERWQHQLNPNVKRTPWTPQQTEKLFELQRKIGNKWATIAQALPGRTDNLAKNHFYASVRKNITKINTALPRIFPKGAPASQIRPFDSDFTGKLILVSQGQFESKVRVNSLDLRDSAREILRGVSSLGDREGQEQHLKEFILQMHNFRLNCKKKKQVRKGKQNSRFVRKEVERQGDISTRKTYGQDGMDTVSRGRRGKLSAETLSVSQTTDHPHIQEKGQAGDDAPFLSEDRIEKDPEISHHPTQGSFGSFPIYGGLPEEHDAPLLEQHFPMYLLPQGQRWDCLQGQLIFTPDVEEEWSVGEAWSHGEMENEEGDVDGGVGASFFGRGFFGDGGLFGRKIGMEAVFQTGDIGIQDEEFPL